MENKKEIFIVLGLLLLVATFGSFIGTKLNHPPTVQEQFLGGITNEKERTVLNAVTATTTGSAILVNDFRNVDATVITTGVSGTLKFACSLSDAEPNFGASKSASNSWDVVEVVDLEDGAAIDGDTGLTFAGSTDVRQFELNTNHFRWCTVISEVNTGTLSVKFLPSNNQ